MKFPNLRALLAHNRQRIAVGLRVRLAQHQERQPNARTSRLNRRLAVIDGEKRP